MIRNLVCAAFLVAASPVAHAQIDAATQAKLDAAAKLGKEINDHDQSAWHVTDKLMAAVPDARNRRIAFVTERVDAENVKTVFLLMEGQTPKVFFTGVVKGSEVVSTENFTTDANPPLATAEQQAQLNASIAVRQAMNRGLCGKPVNTVVLPSANPGELDVYALASETQKGVVQMGGHVRLTIGADGKPKQDSMKSYSNTCISMPYDKDAVGLVVSLPTNLGDTPTEMHVFKSLSHKIPFFVMAGEKLWEVSGDKIKLSDIDVPKPN